MGGRLRYVNDQSNGLTRESTSKGFRYRNVVGKVINSRPVLRRIQSLVIPPAWKDVWICPLENGHLQATGRDARGRKQYRYHPRWVAGRDEQKYSRLLEFGKSLPAIRRRTRRDLSLPGISRQEVTAAVIQLLDKTQLRIGNPEYRDANGTYGLSTLKDRHVTVSGMGLRVRFRGKSGVWHEQKVNDRVLARVVRRCRDLPGQDLFQYLDPRGRKRSLGSADVNAYIREVTGGDFTAKDFRTWAGTVTAAARLASHPLPDTQKKVDALVVEVVREVARALGNTPAVCRKCYIHPLIFESYRAGKWPTATPRPLLSIDEARVVTILRGNR